LNIRYVEVGSQTDLQVLCNFYALFYQRIKNPRVALALHCLRRSRSFTSNVCK